MADTIKASVITDHPFKPQAQWWTLCMYCRMAEAAHRETTVKR